MEGMVAGVQKENREAGETREAGIPWREAKQIVLGTDVADTKSYA